MILIVLFLAALQGCYSFKGSSLPPHLKTIAIPVFEDRSGAGIAQFRGDLTGRLANKIDNEVVRLALSEFKGVEHRQEYVMTVNGVDWVNDSKATNINAMRTALAAVPDTAVLIAGGRDKGNDYASIAALVRQKVSLLIALGESQEKILSAFKGIVAIKAATSLEHAVLLARDAAKAGQTVLFSPGCASFDMFKNFEDRGIQFKECVHQLPLW